MRGNWILKGSETTTATPKKTRKVNAWQVLLRVAAVACNVAVLATKIELPRLSLSLILMVSQLLGGLEISLRCKAYC